MIGDVADGFDIVRECGRKGAGSGESEETSIPGAERDVGKGKDRRLQVGELW